MIACAFYDIISLLLMFQENKILWFNQFAIDKIKSCPVLLSNDI